MGSEDSLLALGLRGKWDEIFHILSESGPNVSNKITTELIFAGDNIIHIGIWKCNLDQIKKLIPWFKFGAHNHKNENYLHTAVKRGDFDIIKLVYQETHFQSLTMKNDMGETPVFISAYRASFQSFGFLFDMFLKQIVPNDNVELDSYDHVLVRADGDNLLHVSLRKGLIDRVSMIIKFFPHLVNLENKNGRTPLHDFATQYHVFKSGHPLSFVRSLLNKCANKMGFCDGKLEEKYDLANKVAKEMTITVNKNRLNPSNDVNLTQDHQIISELPIIIAVKNGIVELVSEILNCCPAEIKARDGRGRNLIFLVVESRQPHMFDFLLKRGYGMNLISETIEGGNNILHVAATFPVKTWDIAGSGFQMLLEALWFERVKVMLPFHLRRLENHEGKSSTHIFVETHRKLLEEGCKSFDIVFKAYGSVVPFAFITTIGLISIASEGSIGCAPFVIHHQTFNGLAALAIAIVIVLQSDLVHVGGFFAGFISTFVDGESYIGTLIRAPIQFTFRVLFIMIALGWLLLSIFLGQMLINNQDAISLFVWAAFLPFMYLLFLSWPLMVDFVNLSFGDLEYYVDRGKKTRNDTI